MKMFLYLSHKYPLNIAFYFSGEQIDERLVKLNTLIKKSISLHQPVSKPFTCIIYL